MNIVLHCNAFGIPPPKLYKWIKRGSSDILSNEKRFLVSKNITTSDAGWYQCIATNGFGNPASQQVYIDVHCKLMCDNLGSGPEEVGWEKERGPATKPMFVCLFCFHFNVLILNAKY